MVHTNFWSSIQVFTEHSTWRGDLKKAAVSIVKAQFHDLITIPDDYHGGQAEAFELIQRKLNAVLEDSSFHLYGKDQNVCSISYWIPETNYPSFCYC